jgi:hypothetical protein
MRKLLYLVAVTLITVGMAVAQNDAGSSASTPTNNSATSADQNAGTTGAATQDQTGAANPSATDQSAPATPGTTGKHRREAAAANGGNLPQSASPLPLLGLLGFGSLAAGAIVRKKNR